MQVFRSALLRFADLSEDQDLVQQTRQAAETLLARPHAEAAAGALSDALADLLSDPDADPAFVAEAHRR